MPVCLAERTRPPRPVHPTIPPPFSQTIDLSLPPELAAGVTSFQAFYDATTKHRKLAWAHAVGGALLKGAFDARPLELQLATMQAAGLMLFNAAPGETLSYVEARRGGGTGGWWWGQVGWAARWGPKRPHSIPPCASTSSAVPRSPECFGRGRQPRAALAVVPEGVQGAG